MVIERELGYLEPGDEFGEWLTEVLAEKLSEPDGEILVYKIEPASHVVCRFEFVDTGINVVGKFFGAPLGVNTRYNSGKAMKNEYDRLRRVSDWILVPRAIAMNQKYRSVLVTTYIPGTNMRRLLAADIPLYKPLTGVSHLLRQLHDNTETICRRDREFAYFHKVLDQNRLPVHRREKFNHLLGAWWYSAHISQDEGCMVHGDATPANYIYDGRIWALDFEGARDHAHRIRDLGILAAEIKASTRNVQAEDYIGHLLWNYSKGETEFHNYAIDLPFFMALGYLRIARLPWRVTERDWLIDEAEACLGTGMG